MNITKLTLASLLSAVSLLLSLNTYAETGALGNQFYANGGIGQNEASEMRAKANDFNLRLYMSEGKKGSFITGAKVTITDKDNKVILDLLQGGPMLFVRVENGSYIINATYKRATITRKVKVASHRGENIYLNWKIKKASKERLNM
jgi:hypothetical protein